MTQPAGDPAASTSRRAPTPGSERPPSAERKIRPPWQVRLLRWVLVILGGLMVVGLLQFLAAGIRLPPLDEAYGWAMVAYPVGLVLGVLFRPNWWPVHILVLLYELALAVLWVVIMSGVANPSSTAWGAVAVPVACLALALAPSTWRYFWPEGSRPAPAPASGPVTINVGRRLNLQILVGALVCLFFGGVGLVGAFRPEAMDGGVGVRVVAGILGSVFTLIGLIFVIGFAFLFGVGRKLTFDEQGIRWDEPRGRSFAVPYAQLSRVVVSIGYTPAAASPSRRSRVRLLLFPAGDAVPDPRMARLRTEIDGQPVYRLPLGANADFVGTVDLAMRRFAPAVYAGVDEGPNFGVHLT